MFLFPLHRVIAAFALTFLFVMPISAQPNVHDGRWRADFTGATGKARTGTVILDGFSGTWDMDTQSKTNPCTGIAAPVTVKQALDEVIVRIERSKAMADCPDTTMHLQRTPEGTLAGTFRGLPFVLTRSSETVNSATSIVADAKSTSTPSAAPATHKAHTGNSRRIQMLYFGGNDCPPCVVWRSTELPKLQQTPIFQTIDFVYVIKAIASPIPSSLFLPNVVKPYKDQLDKAGAGNRGSSQTAVLVDGEVFDFYFGPRTAQEIEDRLQAIRAGGLYPFERCVELRAGNARQCAHLIPRT